MSEDQHDIDVRTKYLQALEDMQQDRLARLGVQVKIAHHTGDNSFPVEYRLRYSFVTATAPTLDMAIAEFIEKLLKFVPVEKAQQAKPETAYLGEPVEPGWLGDLSEAERYNREMDERNRINFENREKPWLPLHDGE